MFRQCWLSMTGFANIGKPDLASAFNKEKPDSESANSQDDHPDKKWRNSKDLMHSQKPANRR
jgi:hypothetical protein